MDYRDRQSRGSNAHRCVRTPPHKAGIAKTFFVPLPRQCTPLAAPEARAERRCTVEARQDGIGGTSSGALGQRPQEGLLGHCTGLAPPPENAKQHTNPSCDKERLERPRADLAFYRPVQILKALAPLFI
jgi:hypothetical protein